jgi:hypothetical protein
MISQLPVVKVIVIICGICILPLAAAAQQFASPVANSSKGFNKQLSTSTARFAFSERVIQIYLAPPASGSPIPAQRTDIKQVEN